MIFDRQTAVILALVSLGKACIYQGDFTRVSVGACVQTLSGLHIIAYEDLIILSP